METASRERGWKKRGWKNRVRQMLYLPLLAGWFVWLLLHTEAVRTAAWEGLRLCGSTVVPSLFPFFVVTSLLLSQGFGAWVSPLFAGLLSSLYRLPGSAGSALVLGLLGGYPVGAKTAAELYRTGSLTRNEAQRLLGFCNNGSPAFFMGVLGGRVFHSVRLGTWLLLIHILSALLTGLLFRGIRTGGPHLDGSPKNQSGGGPDRGPADRLATGVSSPGFPAYNQTGNAPFFSALTEAVGTSAFSMLRLCGFVLFCYVAVSPIGKLHSPLAPLAVGFVEMFSLLPLLPCDRAGFAAAALFSGWGGLCVLGQTAAVLDGSGLSMRTCTAGKAVQGMLSGLLAAALAAAGLLPGL